MPRVFNQINNPLIRINRSRIISFDSAPYIDSKVTNVKNMVNIFLCFIRKGKSRLIFIPSCLSLLLVRNMSSASFYASN